MSSLLIILGSSPHSSAGGQEGLDAALAAAALELSVNILFMDDGVFLLAQKEHPPSFELRDYTKGFGALNDLGVEGMFVDASSIESRGLEVAEFLTKVRVMPQSELNTYIAKHDWVLTF